MAVLSPAAWQNLPLGFMFRPDDDVLINHYLKSKISGVNKEIIEVIPEVDVYRCEPWDLPSKSIVKNDKCQWFFFSPCKRKYLKGHRSNRATEKGYWKSTGNDRKIKCQSNLIGMKKTLVFHRGRAPHAKRTCWVMHEYRTTEKEFDGTKSGQGSFLVYKLFKKSDGKTGSQTDDEADNENEDMHCYNEDANDHEFSNAIGAAPSKAQVIEDAMKASFISEKDIPEPSNPCENPPLFVSNEEEQPYNIEKWLADTGENGTTICDIHEEGPCYSNNTIDVAYPVANTAAEEMNPSLEASGMQEQTPFEPASPQDYEQWISQLADKPFEHPFTLYDFEMGRSTSLFLDDAGPTDQDPPSWAGRMEMLHYDDNNNHSSVPNRLEFAKEEEPLLHFNMLQIVPSEEWSSDEEKKNSSDVANCNAQKQVMASALSDMDDGDSCLLQHEHQSNFGRKLPRYRQESAHVGRKSLLYLSNDLAGSTSHRSSATSDVKFHGPVEQCGPSLDIKAIHGRMAGASRRISLQTRIRTGTDLFPSVKSEFGAKISEEERATIISPMKSRKRSDTANDHLKSEISEGGVSAEGSLNIQASETSQTKNYGSSSIHDEFSHEAIESQRQKSTVVLDNLDETVPQNNASPDGISRTREEIPILSLKSQGRSFTIGNLQAPQSKLDTWSVYYRVCASIFVVIISILAFGIWRYIRS